MPPERGRGGRPAGACHAGSARRGVHRARTGRGAGGTAFRPGESPPSGDAGQPGAASSLPGDAAAFEASLRAADFVICQTGCVGHDDYWRVQDHCRRTGKPCVLVDQPQVVHVVRGLSRPAPAVAEG